MRTTLWQIEHPDFPGFLFHLAGPDGPENEHGEIWIEGLRIQIYSDDCIRIERAEFLQLWRRSENQILEDDEKPIWEQIVDSVDFNRFIAARAALRYVEGKLLRHDSNRGPVIEWPDGLQNDVPKKLAGQFEVLSPNQWFSGFAKFGTEAELTDFERLRLVEGREEPLPDEWPQR